MKLDITVPSAGESVVEGDVARWFKDDGDLVELEEPLVELETDKASLELVAEAAGKLEIVVAEGTTVEVGQVIGHIDADGAGATPKKKGKAAKDDPLAAADKKAAKGEEREFRAASAQHDTVHNLTMPSPAARKLISENKVSAKDIKGTGRNGRITKADVVRYLAALSREENLLSTKRLRTQQLKLTPEDRLPPESELPAMKTPSPAMKAEVADEEWLVPASEEAPAAPPPRAPALLVAPDKPTVPPPAAAPQARGIRQEKMSRIRKTIASNLVAAQKNSALLTTFNEVDLGAVIEMRQRYKEQFKEKYQVGLGFMSFFTTVVCRALQEFPTINASLDGSDIVYHDYCDIGIAVAAPKGLVVPVIRNAEALGFHEIEAAIAGLAKRAREGKLSLDELSGGTFSITNGGVFGSMLSTPIVNYPQSAILGMHNIVERPVARDGEVVIRPVMYVALTYDHRLIDGSEAVRFLVRLKDQLEDPARLMLGL